MDEANVSEKPRRFEVWIDKGVPGMGPIIQIVDVPAGEDADTVCGEALDEMIANDLDTGWREVE